MKTKVLEERDDLWSHDVILRRGTVALAEIVRAPGVYIASDLLNSNLVLLTTFLRFLKSRDIF